MSRLVEVNGVERNLKGWRRDKPDPRDKHLMVNAAVALPPSADLSPKCPAVQDQGQLGSCTANATSSAIAFLEGKGTADETFSRLFIYAKTRDVEGTPLSEDSGAEIRDVMKAVSTYGVPHEKEWPYDVNKFSVEPPESVAKDALNHKVQMYYRCPSLYSLKASIHQGFPVVIGFSVPDNMMSDECAKTGIVKPPARGEAFDGGHCVLAVGYNDKMVAAGIAGWVKCLNSWSKNWALDGYFWLPQAFWYGGAGALVSDCWTIRRAAL